MYRSIPWDRTESFLTFLAEKTASGRYTSCVNCSPWMTWDMLRTMRDAGMTIGGHTVHHRALAYLPENEQEQEICLCGRRLEAELGRPMRYFSYPEGRPFAFNGETRRLLREHGLEYGFSYYGRYHSFGEWDPYDVPRVAVETEINLELFRAMLTLPRVFA